jgi:hypothetical protein
MALVSQAFQECVEIKKKRNRGEEGMRAKRTETHIASFE